ncbi:serine/arginine-rich SC35-like splicing factor SCL30 isoform X4 [Mangifera indica]|uniref:serine/arginine-rich SC35-like splicing factor SCL30 isoform X4 n=1 Tax=Mangifera indica TaxID=29780 RepID=UPI001CF95165|nr:serine/arginine-rich SC35-like splicing factor SCL30 isoform X4 [Mangifera indica]
MRRYSPPYYSSPRRGYVGRGRSPPRRGYGGGGGGYGRRKEQNDGSLLVRNIPLDCRPEELRLPFERFGLVQDVYIARDYYTGEPRGFAFVQFVGPYDAAETQRHMNGKLYAGREIFVVVAAEMRKRPEEMRQRARFSGGSGYDRPQSSYYGPTHLSQDNMNITLFCRGEDMLNTQDHQEDLHKYKALNTLASHILLLMMMLLIRTTAMIMEICQ